MKILNNYEDTIIEGRYLQGSTEWDLERPFIIDVVAGAETIDVLGHVSHAVYLNWLALVTWAHNNHLGLNWFEHEQAGAALAVNKHNAEYFLPLYEGEKIQIATWCTKFDSRFKLERFYQIIRCSDNRTAFRCSTDFVSTDLKNGKPKRLPKLFIDAYNHYFLEQGNTVYPR